MSELSLNRRQFLVAAGLTVACGLASGCDSKLTLPGEVGLALSDSLFFLPKENIGNCLDTVRSLGANAIRFDMDGRVVTQSGWEPIDQIMLAAAQRKLGVLATVSYAPDSNQEPECEGNYGCRPEHADLFAAFAGAAFGRYADWEDIPQFDAEVWNEESTSPGGADPSEYVNLYNQVRVAINKASPKSLVAIGGLAATPTSNGNMSPVDFLSAILAGGIRGYDALCLHPYSFPLLPEQPSPTNAFTQIEGDPRFPNMPTVYNVLKAYNMPNLPLWLTEMGAPTAGLGGISLAAQAETVQQDLRHTFQRANVTRRFIYTFEDRPDIGEYFGLYFADGKPKPAASAFAASAS